MVSFVWLSVVLFVVLFVLADERARERGREGSMRIAVGCGGACFMGQLCVWLCVVVYVFVGVSRAGLFGGCV